MPLIVLIAHLAQIAVTVTPQSAIAPAAISITVSAVSVKTDQLCVVVVPQVPLAPLAPSAPNQVRNTLKARQFSCWHPTGSRVAQIKVAAAGTYHVWAATRPEGLSGVYVHSNVTKVVLE